MDLCVSQVVDVSCILVCDTLSPLHTLTLSPSPHVQHKLADEMVHMIYYMSSQQKAQLEGLEELSKFVSREVTLFSGHGYKQLTEMGYQALAKASLAMQW